MDRLPIPVNVGAQWDRAEQDTAKEATQSPSLKILQECPQFRILIIGGVGVGKTTIVKEVFDVEENAIGVSHGERGEHDINEPRTFPGQNQRIIIHDSRGFEGGDPESFAQVVEFIKERSKKPNLRDQLHSIWYCIACSNEDRPIQFAEEKFFKNLDKMAGKVPVIVVFTKYDELMKKVFAEYMAMNIMSILEKKISLEDMRDTIRERTWARFQKAMDRRYSNVINLVRVGTVELALPRSEDSQGEFKRICEGLEKGVQNLVDLTVRCLEHHGELKTLWATAQNRSADLKCQTSIEQALDCFPSTMAWESVPLIPGYSAVVFWNRFTVLFSKISPIWNVVDKSGLLFKSQVQRQFIKAIYDINAWGKIMMKACDVFGFLGSAVTASTLGQAVAGITLIHQNLFYLQKEQTARGERIHSLTEEELSVVLKKFREDGERGTMTSIFNGESFFLGAYSRERFRDAVTKATKRSDGHEHAL